MNREIKFRAFDGEIMLFYEPQTDEEYDSEWVEMFFRKCHVMQFTGLYDKNGTGIFEGDIVQYHNDSPTVVKYENQGFIVANSHDMCKSQLKIFRDENKWVVIGNIYENPELLKH